MLDSSYSVHLHCRMLGVQFPPSAILFPWLFHLPLRWLTQASLFFSCAEVILGCLRVQTKLNQSPESCSFRNTLSCQVFLLLLASLLLFHAHHTIQYNKGLNLHVWLLVLKSKEDGCP